MNYQIEIDKYIRMRNSLPIGNQIERDRLANIIDNLYICKSASRTDGVKERFFGAFSYAHRDVTLHFPKPDFHPQPHQPRFTGNTPADNASYQERGGM